MSKRFKGSTGGPMSFERKTPKGTAPKRKVPYTKAGKVTIKMVDPATGEEVIVATKKAYKPNEMSAVVNRKPLP